MDTEEQNTENNTIVLSDDGAEKIKYEGNNIKEKALAMLGAFAVTGIVLVVSMVEWNEEKNIVTDDVPYKIVESVPVPPETPNPFSSVSVLAKSAVVYDVNKDVVLYGKNEDKVLPLASVTKLMTALLASEAMGKNRNVAISKYALETEGDSGLFANETWNIKKLIDFTLITSSNDGADAIATAVGGVFSNHSIEHDYEKEDIFVKMMNKKAKEIGLENTKYSNPTGLDEPMGGGRGSAKDMSKLLTYIWENEPSVISETTIFETDFVSEDGFVHHAENTNKYVNEIPGILGSKTGYTDLAGGNLAIVYDAGMDHPVVVVVLGSTLEGRFDDVKKLVDATYEYVASGWYEYDLTVAGSTPKEM